MDNKLKIINKLGKNMEKSYTMHALSIELGIPYATFHRTIKQMEDIIVTENVGNATTIRLDAKNPIARPYLAIASDEERKEFLMNKPIIKKIVDMIREDETAILFGSYAKGEETKTSDIDILVINSEGKRTASFTSLELLHKIKINAIYMTKLEFRQMLKEEGENVGKQALKYHIILKHPERFWEYAM